MVAQQCSMVWLQEERIGTTTVQSCGPEQWPLSRHQCY